MADPKATPPPDLEAVVLASLVDGVLGKGAHVTADRILDGLSWQDAGRAVPGSPYTILQNANHIVYWNGFAVANLRGEKPTPPAHDVDGWPGPAAPANDADWQGFVRAYKASLEALAAQAKERRFAQPVVTRPRLDVLRAMLQHVSYHAGQIALLRRMLGAWPPPGGGDTW